MKNWDDYRLILALSRAGTLRGAAKLLKINHATVSRRLAVINYGHDTPLFEQTATAYRPTSIGEAAITAAAQMETLELSAKRQMHAESDELSGPVCISIPQALLHHILIDPLAEFRVAHPGVELTIETSYQFADLDRSEADIVIRSCTTPPDHLVGRRLFPYALCHYARHDYLANTPPEDRRWLARGYGHDKSGWISKSPFPQAPMAMAVDDISSTHLATLAGLGMMYNACYIGDSEAGLVRLSEPMAVADQNFWVLTHPDLREMPRVRLLMHFLTQALLSKQDLIEGRKPQHQSAHRN